MNSLLIKCMIKSDQFEILVYCYRNIFNVNIPSFIKKIRKDAFRPHKSIKTIDFEINSNVKKTESYSLADSSIEKNINSI